MCWVITDSFPAKASPINARPAFQALNTEDVRNRKGPIKKERGLGIGQ